ncbi:MAG: hypothetical protein WC314_18830 [Vulcanimicrobiota bacterium]
MNRLILLFLLLFLGGSAVAAPPMGLEQRIVPDGEPVPFGQSVELILTLRYPPEAQAPGPDTLDIPGAHILDRFQVQAPPEGSSNRMEYHLVFTRLEPGTFKVPALQIAGAVSNPVEVEFVGAKPLETDRDGEIRGPKAVEELSTTDFWKRAALWVVGLLCLAGVLVWSVNRLGLLDRWRSPRGRALKRVKRLRKQSGTPESLLLGSVEVARSYLHEAYGLTTAESTSREILNQMTMDNRCRELKQTMQNLLETGDGVKFARQTVSESEASDHYENLFSTLREEPR